MSAARAIAAVVSVVALAGCAVPSGGTAFDVNGSTVSTRDVNRAATDCAKLVGSTPDKIRTQVATMYLQGLIAEKVAANNDVTVSDAEKAAVAKSQNLKPLMDGSDCQSAVDTWLNIAVLQQKMGAQKLVSEAQKLTVKVNPVYGPYKASNLSLPGGSGSLSNEGGSPVTLP